MDIKLSALRYVVDANSRYDLTLCYISDDFHEILQNFALDHLDTIKLTLPDLFSSFRISA